MTIAWAGALLVQGQGIAISTDFIRVALAGLCASANHTWNRLRSRRNRIAAEALRSIFETRNGIALATAKVDAVFDSHRLNVSEGSDQSTVSVSVSTTSQVCPTQGLSNIGINTRSDLAKGSRGVAVGNWPRGHRDWITARKGREDTEYRLIYHRGYAALGARDCRFGEEATTVHVIRATKIRAGEAVNSVLKCLLVPTIDL